MALSPTATGRGLCPQQKAGVRWSEKLSWGSVGSALEVPPEGMRLLGSRLQCIGLGLRQCKKPNCTTYDDHRSNQ